MALKLSSRNLFRSADILQKQSEKNKSSLSNVGKTLQKQSVFKRQSIAKRKNLYAQRATAIRRKNQQDFLDASRSTGSRRSVGQIVRGSNKGFFGRILEVVSFAMVGWAVQNLPRIVVMANKLGQQIPKLTTIMSSFMNNTFSILQEIGSLSSGLVRSLLAFDFNSMGRQVQTSLVNLSIQFGRLEDDLYEGMKVFAEVFKFEPAESPPGQQLPPGQPAPSPSGPGGKYTIEELVQLARQAGFKGQNAAVAASVAYAESGGDPTTDTVKSGTDPNKRNEYSIGLWQINMIDRPGYMLGQERRKKFGLKSNEDLRDPSINARVALGISGGSDFRAWTTYNSGAYRPYIPKAQEALKKSTPTQTRPASTNFTAVTGTSGSVKVAGRAQAPLSVPYSPFKPGSRMTITSGIGYRSSTNSNHSGYDIAGPEGTPIYAYFPGKIINVGVWNGSFSGYGNYVVWQDDIYGAYHFFGHLRDRPGWSPGQKFSQGTLIGYVGNTGRSTGPHLHWEISESRPDSIGNFSSLEDPGSWLRKHPLVFSSTSQRTPAQISSTRVTQNIPENITPSNEGETIYVTVPQQAYQNAGMSAGAGGGGSTIIGGGDSLNSLIKQRILLELAYT